MHLKVYLKKKNIHLRDLAEQIDYNYRHLKLVIRGKAYPGAKLVRAIEKATNGEVVLLTKKQQIKKDRDTRQKALLAIDPDAPTRPDWNLSSDIICLPYESRGMPKSE